MFGWPVALWFALGWLYAMRELQLETVLRLIEARHRGLPGKVHEAAA